MNNPNAAPITRTPLKSVLPVLLIPLFFFMPTAILSAGDSAGNENAKYRLIRYYRLVEQWMHTASYDAVMNDFDKSWEKTESIAQTCGFADSDALSEAETELEEDADVQSAYDKMLEVARLKRDRANAANTGNVSLHFNTPSNRKYIPVLNRLRESQILSTLADHLNDFFYFPQDIVISVEECREENAFYDSEQKKIIICYEMVHHYIKYLEKDSDSENMAEDLTTFDVLHEFGHALIDVMDLPVTGKEEDVADQLAAWLILETLDDDNSSGLISLLSAAYWFANEFDKDQSGVEELQYWDEHSLDPQRFYNILCWACGYNMEIMEEALGEDLDEVLPEDRRSSCETEYARINLSFLRLLYRYMKE